MMELISLLLMFVGLTLQSAGQTSPRFEDYEVAIYRGSFHEPKWIRRVADEEWRDELGKLVERPKINFAGDILSPYIAAVLVADTTP